MEICPVEAKLFPREKTDGWTNGQADMTKLIVAFYNFAKPPPPHPKNTIQNLV
jgi:hypothetical protein